MKDEYEAKWWADHYIKAENTVHTLVGVVVVLVIALFGAVTIILVMAERF